MTKDCPVCEHSLFGNYCGNCDVIVTTNGYIVSGI